jgi:hypothetical protein
MRELKIDRRKNNGGHSTKGKAGAKAMLIDPVKLTITFNGKEAEKLREIGEYNLLVRELVANYFGLSSPLTENFDKLIFGSDASV